MQFFAIFLTSFFAAAQIFAQAPQPINQPLPAPLQVQQQPKNTDTILDDIAECIINEKVMNDILGRVRQKNPEAVRALPDCFKLDRKLMLQVALIDPLQFQYAGISLKSDPIFIKRLIKFSPEILQFASMEILSDKDFMERATYISRNSLQYAHPALLDNKPFMKRMITIDSQNYVFASARLKEMPDIATIAFSDNGALLSSAPPKIRDDKKLVKIAVQSNHLALGYASLNLQENKELKMLVNRERSSLNRDKVSDFLKENYLEKEKKKNLGSSIGNQAKFFKEQQIINRNYITKWQHVLDFSGSDVAENSRLIAAESRNYPISWREDFAKYPSIIKKIEGFFHNHQVADNVIDNLKTLYFWKIKDKPQTYAFNLYLLRDSNEIELGPDFANVTSITAIVQKTPKKWTMTIVEVIIDSEVRTNLAFANGHKKYALWDLYAVGEKDKNPKIIFKVEDKFNQYFEIFEEQSGGKYQMVYRLDLLSKEFEDSTKDIF